MALRMICGFILFFSGLAVSQQGSQPLIVGVNAWPPWIIQKPTGDWHGIAIDTLRLIATCSEIPMQIRDLPNAKRMRQEWGTKINAEAAVSPSWRQDQKQSSVYTESIFSTQDIILARKGTLSLGRSPSDFYGQTLGIIRGYFYPEGFSDAISENKIAVSESSPDTLLPKLLRGRVKGIFINRDEASYLFNTIVLNPADEFHPVYLFKEVQLHIRLHKSKQDLLPRLNQAISQLKASGIIHNIKRYYTSQSKQQSYLELSKCPITLDSRA
ncbi:substrate-binding periplasmic protein [Dongshaea marina]|uniref:substrate-binding periplasmic protein n=1 Tax=Dongshaea marina TaxID=2047966 RepID=UPI000D3E3037|nr:transporter substrate-binding domain-containing protein [Dongshaea marina]